MGPMSDGMLHERGHCSCDACLHQLEVSRRLADALRAWQEWAALLLDTLDEPPTHSDGASRDVITQLFALELQLQHEILHQEDG